MNNSYAKQNVKDVPISYIVQFLHVVKTFKKNTYEWEVVFLRLMTSFQVLQSILDYAFSMTSCL